MSIDHLERMLQHTVTRVQVRAAAQSRQMMGVLADGCWHTAKALSARGIGDRIARAVAEASHGGIISGQHGYRLTTSATTDEIAHAEHWLRAQAHKMIQRANEIRARASTRPASEVK